MEAANETGKNHAGAQSRVGEAGANLSVGLEAVDPDFMRLIEMSLMAMTDYARNKTEAEPHAGMKLVMTRDVERAEKILERIADWHEASNVEIRG